MCLPDRDLDGSMRKMRGTLLVVLLVSACGNKAPHVTGDSGVTDSTAPGDIATDGPSNDASIDAATDAMMGTLSPDPAEPVAAPCAGRLGFPGRPVVRLLGNNNALSALELGDVTGDGKPDLVFWSGTAIEMAAGNGDGTYGTRTTIGNGLGSPPSFVLADVNGDAKLDLVHGDRFATSLYVRLNNGAGGFAAATTHSIGTMGTVQVEARDLNNDGRRDLIALTGFDIVVLLNSASGFGAPTAFTTKNIGESMFFALGDISGDGKLDAVASNLDGSASLLVNDGAGAFGLPVIFSGSGGQGGRIDVGDLDEDGKLDVVVGGVTNAQVGMVSVLRNQGGSTFAAHVDYLTGSSYAPRALAIGDTNADGHLDVVAGSAGGNSDIELLLGNGNGTFSGAVAMAADFPSDIVLADVNGDAKLDLITSGDASVRTYLNRATAFPFDQRRMFDYGGVQVPSARVLDVNSDNTPDLVTSLYSASGNSVVARLGTGGSFGAVSAPLIAAFYPQFTYVTDLDNDARLDLVALGLIGGMIQIVMNNGNGTFAAQMPLTTPYDSRRIAAADFDGDGYRDLAIGSSNGTIGLFHGHGNGMVSFAGNVWTGTSVMGVGYGDVDKDGHSDLLVSGGTNGVFFIDVVRGNGNGTFAQPLSISLGHTPPTRLLVRDFNADGNPDILESGNGWLGVLVATGSGSFAPSNAQLVGSSEDAVVADLNGDAKRDVVTFDYNSASILVMIGRGDGTFDPPLYYDAGRGQRSLSVVDVNGDGRLDVVVNNWNAASILWGRCLP
jgi:hypothetical protein